MIDFGKRLKALRIEHGLTQKQLGERIGLRGSIISFYEVGDRIPSPEIIIKLATVFHVTSDYLLGLEHDRTIITDGLSEESIAIVYRMVEHLRRSDNKLL